MDKEQARELLLDECDNLVAAINNHCDYRKVNYVATDMGFRIFIDGHLSSLCSNVDSVYNRLTTIAREHNVHPE